MPFLPHAAEVVAEARRAVPLLLGVSQLVVGLQLARLPFALLDVERLHGVRARRLLRVRPILWLLQDVTPLVEARELGLVRLRDSTPA